MSELISGKEAKLAWANGHIVQWRHRNNGAWNDLLENRILSCFDDARTDWRVKPQTIVIGDVEVPAPFEPKEYERFYYFSDEYTTGYASAENTGFYGDMKLGAWRTEAEIKQVVAALRKLFKGATQ